MLSCGPEPSPKTKTLGISNWKHKNNLRKFCRGLKFCLPPLTLIPICEIRSKSLVVHYSRKEIQITFHLVNFAFVCKMLSIFTVYNDAQHHIYDTRGWVWYRSKDVWILGYLDLQKYSIFSGPMPPAKLFWVKNKPCLIWVQKNEV